MKNPWKTNSNKLKRYYTYLYNHNNFFLSIYFSFREKKFKLV